MKRGEGIERVLAWVKLNSVARGSPFCVNASGDALTSKEAAKDLGLAPQTVKNCCTILAAQGRIRLQKGYRIWYRADVAEPAAPRLPRERGERDDEPEETQSGGRNEGEEASESEYRVHGIFPEYLTDFIKKLSPAKKATLDAYSTWRKRLFADGMAALRAIDEQVQDTTLLSLGVNKKRLPKRRQADSKWVQLSLLDTPSFLDPAKYSVHGRPVQSTDLPAYKPDSGFVRGTSAPPILIAVEPLTRTLKESVSQSPPRPTDRHADSDDYGAKTQALKTLLLDEYGRRFPGETPSTRLCASVLAALAGAPLELLQVQIRQRMKSSTSMGFALKLAEDVGERWKEDRPRYEQAERERIAREKREKQIDALRTQELVDDCRRVLSNPKASGKERQEAQEYLDLVAKTRHASANREETRALCQETLDDPRASGQDKELARDVLKSMAAAGGAL